MGTIRDVRQHRSRHEAASRRWMRIASALVPLACAACSAHGSSTTVRGNGAAAGSSGARDAPIVPTKICADDNPFCGPQTTVTTGAGPASDASTAMSCGAVPIDLHPTGVNIMIAVDGAAGMATHWSDIETAIRSLRDYNKSASFGLHLFWADAVDLANGQTNSNTTNNGCSEVHNKVLDVGDNDTQALLNYLGSAPPGGTITDAYQVDPLIDALSYYLDNATKLTDPSRTNYLVIVTSGNDNCFGSAFADKSDKALTYQKLAVELTKRNIRVIPVGVDPPSSDPMDAAAPLGPTGTSTIMGIPGLGGTTTAPTTDYETLGTLLKYGGSALQDVPRIDSQAQLMQLVSEVGAVVGSCRFSIPAALDSSASLNPFELSFSINGKVVPRDRHQVNGWDFVDNTTSQVEFFGQGCQALQAGQSVVANKSCEQDVCGTAAINVSTKPRSVLFLLDSSLSRTECTDGSTDCLSLPGTPGRPLTYWEVVEHAVEQALAAPVNDDVSFGMQFFPSKNADDLSCDVAAQPEIPPAPGRQILIMKEMLEKFPFGLSPDVAVMESVAAAPGPLADPNVVGAVVLLSDGGDNCSGGTQQEIVMRLGAAAKKLLQAGVKTYAIRYGSADGETSDQAEQLSAIVTNGGTALTGGQVPYIDAKSPDELGQALAQLSDRLASCSFQVEGLKPDVDKSRTNVFLNGDQIGFDAKGTKQNGWNWADPAQTVIELYGDACTQYKTSLHTRVALEFGCQPVLAPE